MATLLFGLFFFALVYIYFGYPIALFLIPGWRCSRNKLEDNLPWPAVTLVVPAYNEARYVVKKLKNALDLDYPSDRFEIILTSDGSTDETVSRALTIKDSRINVLDNKERKGKNAALNAAVKIAKGDILVFTDTNAMYSPNAIKSMVKHFAIEKTGIVCGHLKYHKQDAPLVGQGEGLYFRYESLIKKLESKNGALAVVTGAIYAIRRSLFVPLEPDVANDFAHPVQVGAKGYHVIYEPSAIAYEKSTASIREEFLRRSRIVTRGFTAFGKYWRRYHILKGLRGFCFFSHKLLRWFAPVFLTGLLITNFFLRSPFFNFTLACQILFYLAAAVGFVSKNQKSKLVIVPFYFLMINFAAAVGLVNYLRGKRQAIWDIASTTR